MVEYQKLSAESITSWDQDPSADCAIVLTGGSNRVREGFDLLTRGQVKKLIISGVYSEANLREVLPLWSAYGLASEKDVILEKRSGTTYGNAQQSLALVEALRCRDVILVTSQVHMSRAYRTFRGAFPADYPIYKHSVFSGRGETQFFEVGTEVLKSLFYSLFAY